MALNPPVIFLQGDWESNTTYLKSMTQEQQDLYGFSAQSGINSLWIGKDDSNINGSDKMLVIGSKSLAASNIVIAIGFFTLSYKGYTPEQNPTFSRKLILTPSTSINFNVIRRYSPKSQYDSRINFENQETSSWARSPVGPVSFSELRIISGGIISTSEWWAISVGNSVSYAWYYSSSGGPDTPQVDVATATPDGIYSSSSETIQRIGLDTHGTAVLQQYKAGLNLWQVTSTQLPGMAPFIIWDNIIYAQVYGSAYIQLGGLIL